jgi:hypothetical protein
MDAGIAHDKSLLPIVTLPVQFRDMWNGSRPTSSEMLLALSVLGEAVNDLRSYRFAPRRRQQRLYAEAYTWIASNDRSWPYAFCNLCDALRLAPESVRVQVLNDAPTGASLPYRSAALAPRAIAATRRPFGSTGRPA